MKLLAITLPSPVRGYRNFPDHIDIGSLPPPFREWTVSVKGAMVRLVSPPGWQINGGKEGRLRRVVEIARERCTLQWEAEENELDDNNDSRKTK